MNILIKLMSIVSLVIAPSLAQIHNTGAPEIGKTEKNIIITISDSVGQVIQENITTEPGQDLISVLRKDGLLNQTENTISVEKGVLMVNGKVIEDAKYLKLIKVENMKVILSEKHS
jgi:K(+)-stimulated pyrophosphate-energized sodium pump